MNGYTVVQADEGTISLVVDLPETTHALLQTTRELGIPDSEAIAFSLSVVGPHLPTLMAQQQQAA